MSDFLKRAILFTGLFLMFYGGGRIIDGLTRFPSECQPAPIARPTAEDQADMDAAMLDSQP